MSTDDRFDEQLREASARDYHAPPASVPRDEMWERIAAARAARRSSAGATPVTTAGDDTAHVAGDATATPDVVVLPVRRWPALSKRPAWARALAAALLLAVGIGVGRLSVSRERASSAANRAPVVASGAAPAPTTPAESSPTPASSSSSSPSPVTVAVAGGAGSSRSTARPEGSRDTPGAERGQPSAENQEPSADSREPRAALPYRLAAAEHLALTETLLTTVSADARAGRADSSVALWARDLLGTTRMLLDSPAARDPKLARLLEDLELVLAEVAQLHPARGPGELQAIDRAVRQRGVLTRLRATLPAGPLSAGT
ncbi:MAG TPA: hypothetical protein VNS52_09160 [Gemmatimonadaceae bacterium]|nr:hypothetical protein [Gemmatimonadaceae bacterium]